MLNSEKGASSALYIAKGYLSTYFFITGYFLIEN